MFKKAGAVAIAAAGLMLLGSPAFATPHHDGGYGDDYTAIGELHYFEDAQDGAENDQFGLINFADDSDLLSNLNVCEVELNVLAIPILSNNDESLCINTDNDGNSGHGLHGE
ncbi:hypothetical protein ACIGNX_32070 [Actinosynnema sp. NPDC053489]|uniref:hypothetical protein n=1 Tax=Actinosynnema sp. NPDC053489 TaxID=3363916 RepID=UPI0037C768BA